VKNILASAALATALTVAGGTFAFADCAADIQAASDAAGKATDAGKKDAAMKQVAMAKDAMGKKDDAACKTATDAAMAALK
jgi:hypothetical protein